MTSSPAFTSGFPLTNTGWFRPRADNRHVPMALIGSIEGLPPGQQVDNMIRHTRVMNLDMPKGTADATDLRRLSGVETALPVLVSAENEILSFGAISDTDGALYAYSPLGGWRIIDAIDRECDPDLESAWSRLCENAINYPVPKGMTAIQTLGEAREVYRNLLEEETAD